MSIKMILRKAVLSELPLALILERGIKMRTTIFFAVLFFPLCVCLGQNSGAMIPQTKSGKLLTEWLLIFSSGNKTNYQKFITANYSKELLEKNYGAEYLADRQARKYIDAKKYDIKQIENSTEKETKIIAQANLTGLWFRISLKLDSLQSNKIAEYTAQRIPPPIKYAEFTPAELAKQTDAFMTHLANEDGFSGSVLVAKNDKPIFQRSYNYANKGYSSLNNNGTKYNLASIGKVFTSIAVCQLIEQGKLSLKDTIGKFITDYPNKQVSSQVTVHHLLTHTSGLGDIHGTEYICKKGTLREVKDYFSLFEKDSLEFTPGEKCQYSNVGFIILGAIIEKASGENYFDYIKNHIFKPCNMVNTGFYEADIDVPNRATGYTNFKDIGDDNFEFEIGQRRNTNLYNIARGNPQGGVYSTLTDLLLFTKAFKTNKLVSADTYKLMTTNKTFFRKYDASEVYYGYGLELEIENGKRVIGHGGGDLGISTALRMYPDPGDYTVIVLSNYDRGGILTIYKIQEWLTQYENKKN
jgi:CubicO group peptidase (beta-lactamase class C family)